MANDDVTVDEQVDQALRDVLGYLPEREDDLTGSVDSMQRLELLITLEQSLAVPFDDDALAAPWWSTRKGITGYVHEALAARRTAGEAATGS